MITWTDELCNSRRRLFSCNEVKGSIEGIIREMIEFCAESLAGQGNSIFFDTIFFEFSSDTGRIIMALGTEEGYLQGKIDGCTVVLEPLPARYDTLSDTTLNKSLTAPEIDAIVEEMFARELAQQESIFRLSEKLRFRILGCD